MPIANRYTKELSRFLLRPQGERLLLRRTELKRSERPQQSQSRSLLIAARPTIS